MIHDRSERPVYCCKLAFIANVIFNIQISFGKKKKPLSTTLHVKLDLYALDT